MRQKHSLHHFYHHDTIPLLRCRHKPSFKMSAYTIFFPTRLPQQPLCSSSCCRCSNLRTRYPHGEPLLIIFLPNLYISNHIRYLTWPLPYKINKLRTKLSETCFWNISIAVFPDSTIYSYHLLFFVHSSFKINSTSHCLRAKIPPLLVSALSQTPQEVPTLNVFLSCKKNYTPPCPYIYLASIGSSNAFGVSSIQFPLFMVILGSPI